MKIKLFNLVVTLGILLAVMLAGATSASATKYGKLQKGVVVGMSNNGSTEPLTYKYPRGDAIEQRLTLPNGYVVGQPTKVVLQLRYVNAKFRAKIGYKKYYRSRFHRVFGKKSWRIPITLQASWAFSTVRPNARFSMRKVVRLRPRQTKKVVFWVTFPECVAPLDESWLQEWRLHYGDNLPNWSCNPAGLSIEYGVGERPVSLKATKRIAGKKHRWIAYAPFYAPQAPAYLYPAQ